MMVFICAECGNVARPIERPAADLFGRIATVSRQLSLRSVMFRHHSALLGEHHGESLVPNPDPNPVINATFPLSFIAKPFL